MTCGATAPSCWCSAWRRGLPAAVPARRRHPERRQRRRPGAVQTPQWRGWMCTPTMTGARASSGRSTSCLHPTALPQCGEQCSSWAKGAYSMHPGRARRNSSHRSADAQGAAVDEALLHLPGTLSLIQSKPPAARLTPIIPPLPLRTYTRSPINAPKPKQPLHSRWEIPAGTRAGTYRLKHFGNRKALLGGVKEYEGTSGEFVVATDKVNPCEMGITLPAGCLTAERDGNMCPFWTLRTHARSTGCKQQLAGVSAPQALHY